MTSFDMKRPDTKAIRARLDAASGSKFEFRTIKEFQRITNTEISRLSITGTLSSEDLLTLFENAPTDIAALLDEIERLREALYEIATADHCLDGAWQTEPDKSKWCVTCVAADALGWDRTKLVTESGGTEYLCDDERTALEGERDDET